MPESFLAVENPLGVLGHKIIGPVDDPNDGRLKKLERQLKNKQADAAEFLERNPQGQDVHKYVNRYNRIKARDAEQKKPDDKVLPTLVKDVRENLEVVLEFLADKALYPNLRIGMCSSMQSTLKYINTYITGNPGTQFDTLILYGHGSAGNISIGLSKYRIGPPLNSGDDGYEDRTFARETWGLDQPRAQPGQPRQVRRVRNIDLNNTSDWINTFTAAVANNQFVTNPATKYFHVFLMGCEVGQAHKSKLLTEELANLIKSTAKLETCVAAPTEKIYPKHLKSLLSDLDNIRDLCSCEDPCSLDGGINLTSSTS